jgi:hypothetical protein
MTMRNTLLALAAPLLLSACISLSSSPSQPAPNTTVVVPPGSTAVCADGTVPPCR